LGPLRPTPLYLLQRSFPTLAGAAAVTNPTFVDPTAALGSPSGITGVLAGFPNVLSPFSPAFDVGQIVIVGEGGQLTLQFPMAISTAAGAAIGVVSNVGLIDNDFPNGQVGSPASSFGGGSAIVSVQCRWRPFWCRWALNHS